MDRKLADIPARMAAVATVLLPGRPAPAERVTGGGSVTAAMPLRADAISVLGPGAEVPRLHPLVRHWSATRKVTVTALRGGRPVQVTVTLTDWFHEAVVDEHGAPVTVADEDQVGIVPPREWLDMQARKVRSHFGHHVPPRTLRPRRDLRRATAEHLPAARRAMLGVPGGPAALAFLAAAGTVGADHLRRANVGVLGRLNQAERPDDPVMDDLERRGHPPAVPHSVRWDVDYLRLWLTKACAEGALDVPAFAAQLGGLHAEISRVLGATEDQTYLGRCPAFLADHGPDGEPAGRRRPCGARLYQDNTSWSAQARCPRCRTVWDTRGHAGAGTAREIRRVWPIDRMRRYTAEQRRRAGAVHCPACRCRAAVTWRDVTGTSDKQRTWQPVTAVCPFGHPEAGHLV